MAEWGRKEYKKPWPSRWHVWTWGAFFLSGALGLFVRSLVGLDRGAARQALQAFLSGRTLTANQHQFVDLVVDLLTRRGYVDPAQLYDPPFTNSHPEGVAGLFSDSDVTQLVATLTAIRENAEGAGAS
jgi:type I restriction enzyme R subunit